MKGTPVTAAPKDPWNMNQIVGSHDILLMTLDTLRFDVATQLWHEGALPSFQSVMPESGWEQRHTSGSFTYAAHHAFFAGFLPTPATPGRHPRLFAARFAGSETTTGTTCVFDAPTIVEGLCARGYHTICIGGVGFFNKKTALGQVLPGLFTESHWSEALGVTDPQSTYNQFTLAAQRLQALPATQRSFLFINVSAMHQPNYFYLDPPAPDKQDTLASHAAALQYVDTQLPILLRALQQRGPCFCIICADHGTAYGEDGYTGHRLAHQVVWNVPYTAFVLPENA